MVTIGPSAVDPSTRSPSRTLSSIGDENLTPPERWCAAASSIAATARLSRSTCAEERDADAGSRTEEVATARTSRIARVPAVTLSCSGVVPTGLPSTITVSPGSGDSIMTARSAGGRAGRCVTSRAMMAPSANATTPIATAIHAARDPIQRLRSARASRSAGSTVPAISRVSLRAPAISRRSVT